MRNIFIKTGEITLSSCRSIGSLVLFIIAIFKISITTQMNIKQFFKYCFEIAFCSLPVIGLTAIFTGAVLALQSYTGFSRFHGESAVASIVVISITRELGPVLASLMLSGRLSSSTAAELASMRISEQLDAMLTLNNNPLQFLIVPRILACVISLPILVIITDIIGVMGGYLIAIHKIGVTPEIYLRNTIDFLSFNDVLSGLIKAVFFGFFICVISCYNGYNAHGGAYGVGTAATQSVVFSSIMILLLNYLITGIMFNK